ncbi:hypothetical protein [Flaviflexus massiliensis]|uniref:hypothetical protein n=1 Tax=Flaviflexus massiliensis TaxID=1522309 RepID=UPI0006D55939|nr:hypothetical protein [Flaviflexus massiliensis]
MSQQPDGPQGQNFGQNNNFQQNQNPQEGYAPSAYSAPQPGYGQQQAPYGQQQSFGQPSFGPQQSSGFGALFSTSFASRATSSLLKNLMLVGIIAFGIYAGYALFDLISIIASDYGPGAMTIIAEIIHFAFRVSIGLVLLGLLRISLEFFGEQDKKADSNSN